MLSQLYIENIAVIKEAAITLTPGFNVFTGETGAGKSILIGAINAVLGERTSRDLIRTGETTATVSAVFTGCSHHLTNLLTQLGFPADPEELLITREVQVDGKSSCRINGKPATAAILRQLAAELLTIHGQHDNQQLITPEQHMGFVDDYGRLTQELSAYRTAYRTLTQLREEREALSMDEGEKARRTDLLQYQIGEIEGADLQPGEEEELSALRRRMRNREKLVELLTAATATLTGDGELPGVLELFEGMVHSLTQAGQYLPALSEAGLKLQEMQYELQEYSITVSDALEELEYDPTQAEETENRWALLQQLKKKYGSSVEEILLFLARSREELDAITFSQERLEALEAQYAKQEGEVLTLGRALREKRKTAAAAFTAAVREELSFLDMPGVELTVRFQERAPGPNGLDEVELFISTNPGEPPKPLAKIASGGELSRVMLSIKNTMAAEGGVDTLIFDEVDTGVSGRAAQKIGRKLQQVSHNRQVICVTHLAQVAAYGVNHLLIEKQVEEGRTFTRVRTLSPEERPQELARIISGDSVTKTSLLTAQEMLTAAQAFSH